MALVEIRWKKVTKIVKNYFLSLHVLLDNIIGGMKHQVAALKADEDQPQ